MHSLLNLQSNNQIKKGKTEEDFQSFCYTTGQPKVTVHECFCHRAYFLERMFVRFVSLATHPDNFSKYHENKDCHVVMSTCSP